LHLPHEVRVREDLQIHQPDVVPVGAHGGGDPFEAERLEAEVDLGIHQGTGVNEQHAHEMSSACCCWATLYRTVQATVAETMWSGGRTTGTYELRDAPEPSVFAQQALHHCFRRHPVVGAEHAAIHHRLGGGVEHL